MKAPSEESTANQHKEHNAEKYIQCVTTLFSFSCYWILNLRNPSKLSENSNLQQFKVIQCHRSWCYSKEHMQLPIIH